MALRSSRLGQRRFSEQRQRRLADDRARWLTGPAQKSLSEQKALVARETGGNTVQSRWFRSAGRSKGRWPDANCRSPRQLELRIRQRSPVPLWAGNGSASGFDRGALAVGQGGHVRAAIRRTLTIDPRAARNQGETSDDE